FVEANLDTSLIDREETLLFPPAATVPTEVWMLAALAELLREARQAQRATAFTVDRHSPWNALDGWRLNGHAGRSIMLRMGEQQQQVEIEASSHGYRLAVGDVSVAAHATLGPGSELQAQLGERRLRAAVVPSHERRQVFFGGR